MNSRGSDLIPGQGSKGLPCGSAGKESACNTGDLCLIPGLGRSPGEGNRLSTPVFWPGEFHGLYSPQGRWVGHDWVTLTLTSGKKDPACHIAWTKTNWKNGVILYQFHRFFVWVIWVNMSQTLGNELCTQWELSLYKWKLLPLCGPIP